MLARVVIIVVTYAALLGGCGMLRAAGSPYAVVVALLGTTVSLSYSVLYFANEFRHDRIVSGQGRVDDAARIRRRRRWLTWSGVMLVNLGQLGFFAFLFQHFHDVGGNRFFSYEGEPGYVDWLLYTIDCTFKSVLDLPEIFDLHLRNIRHHGLVGGVVVAVVRGMIYSLLVAAVLRRIAHRRMARETAIALNNAPRMAGSRLVRMGEEALPHLRRVLRRPGFFEPDHEDEVLRRNEHSRPVLDLLLDRLWSGDEVERRNAAVLLGLLAPEDPSRRPYWHALLDAARSDPAAAVRVAAVDSLGRIDDPRVPERLRSLLEASDPGVRATAARALARLSPCQAAPESRLRSAL